ncbi:alginate export family protein [Aquimarina sp. ERC-38]|uniref:hypothetical protein n=1 Tax=Aquimarina sp. ERC-38 TaxID=2949996 RepID=UPI0022484FCA|nr:hypothetical protein [Aquimarina sp. ERC-38]UZO80183.1 alginate export family protein [Aquimarina sp. ERC-38]
MKKQFIYIITLLFACQIAQAQFKLSGEFKPRTEFRHGFGNLIPDAAEPGFGISTRVRLNSDYTFGAYELYVSLQDVAVWGENRQILPFDQNNSFAVFQAWAKINLGSGWSTKLGRQVLSYDDQRILGGLDWAQQGRNHDLGLFTYKSEKFKADFGFAWNQDTQNPTGFDSVGNLYTITGFFSYKHMQYMHLNFKNKGLNGSLLVLNNGFQDFTRDADGNIDSFGGISSLQTFGAHLNYKLGDLGILFNGYLQTGDRQNEVDVKGAYLTSLDLNYKTSSVVNLGIGAEIISGNDGEAGETGAFFPLYGTNHKFNGFMDYFYVGNHANSVGLIDLHASVKFNTSETSNLLIKVLNFSGEQETAGGEKSLGTEVDIVFAKKFKGFALAAGYSQMFASDGLYEIRNITEDAAADVQNWAWLQLVFKPNFFENFDPKE